MFGFGAEIFIIILIIAVLYGYTLSKHSAPSKSVNVSDARSDQRRCYACGYIGPMKTWLSNYNFPQFILLLGLIFAVIPGLIFLLWGWGKHKCPKCGALGKSTTHISSEADITPPDQKKRCPYCAEDIQLQAVVCRYCGRDLPRVVQG